MVAHICSITGIANPSHFYGPVVSTSVAVDQNVSPSWTSATSLSTFQRHLKTFLFRKSFPDIIAD